MRFEEILVMLTVITGIVWVGNLVYRKIKHLPMKGKTRFWLLNEIIAVFPVLVIVLLLRSFLYEPFRIPTGSMKPTLLEGDFILVNKYAYGVRLPVTGTTIAPVAKPKVGDIVVFRHTDGKDLIKRVVGVPGDRVQYVDKQLYINGKLIPHVMLDETQDSGIFAIESKEHLDNIVHNIYDYPQAHRTYRYSDVIVPDNSYFVIGDNRSNSEDSRVWGFVREEDLLGKAVATWMSWNSNDSRILPIRWSRIGKSIYVYSDKQ